MGFRGRMNAMVLPPAWRGTTMQVCGLFPFISGTGTPTIGVPLGTHLLTGATVCFDPISWFQRAHLISNPSAFVMGLPGLGKSTLVRRIVTGLEGFGVHTMILGDLKPDYVALVRALGGQVIRIGRGIGGINPLDVGDSVSYAARMSSSGARELDAANHGRRLNMLTTLIRLSRRSEVSDRERSILSAILAILGEDRARQPLISDVLRVLRQAPRPVHDQALDRGDDVRYRRITEDLEASLMGMLQGTFGTVFANPTSVPMRLDRSVVFDLSAVDEKDDILQAAALLTCWSYGFAQVDAAQMAADEGLAPRRNYLLVMDEVWRAMRAGEGMVDRIDALTRLNRAKGVGNIMITHTMKDLDSLPTEEDRMKARGFVERAGAVIIGGIPGAEMPLVTPVVSLSNQEQLMVSSWSTPPSWDENAGREGAAPGRGKFLIKVGQRPGIPTQVRLTSVEANVNDTNTRWHS